MRLTKVAEVTYRAYNGTEFLGVATRTGSLPSCYRWWAIDPDGQTIGVSKRTRKEAAAQLERTDRDQ